jgi:hypothetical protein
MAVEKELPPIPPQTPEPEKASASRPPFTFALAFMLPTWGVKGKERYFGLQKKTAVVVAVGVVAFLALMLGLSIGLTVGRGKSYAPIISQPGIS